MFNFIYTNSLQKDVPEIYKLLSLVLSLPSTSASVESSFSTLKRIKNFLRNSIEIELIKILQEDKDFKFYDKVIDDFALQKNRRIDLIYKNI
jgi:hypothetical protein